MTPARAYELALADDFMLFIEQCFVTLNPGLPFVENWHLHAVAEPLRRVETRQTKRLVINVPPRSGKSIMTTTGFSAWMQGQDPRSRIICVSSDDSADHAVPTTMARRAKLVVFSPQSTLGREARALP